MWRRHTCGSFLAATYNVRNERQEELYNATQALREETVDVAMVQETKMLGLGFPTRK